MTDRQITIIQSPQIQATVVVPATPITAEVSRQGPAGPPGPASTVPGPPGPPGTDKNYTHDQMTPSSLWIVAHGLGKIPSVTVFDSAGDEVEGDVKNLDLNTTTIEFSAAFSGKAYLN